MLSCIFRQFICNYEGELIDVNEYWLRYPSGVVSMPGLYGRRASKVSPVYGL